MLHAALFLAVLRRSSGAVAGMTMNMRPQLELGTHNQPLTEYRDHGMSDSSYSASEGEDTFTSCLPRFFPSKRPCKAAGADSSPSAICSV